MSVLLVTLLLGLCWASPPYGYQPPVEPYLPAPPGKTPPCIKYGKTYCEEVEHYPEHLIQYLAERWVYDYNMLFLSDRPNSFKPRPEYGPSYSHYHKSYTFGPKQLHQSTLPYYAHQTLPTQINQTQVHNGYPDRRYTLGSPQQYLYSEDPGFIYSALIHPNVTPYDPNQWWKRYTRSERKKRQVGTDSLCPTRTDYIEPKVAMNSDGNYKYIVNLKSDPRFRQLVQAVQCLSNGAECNAICSLPNSYSSRCTQQYVQKKLVALDGSGRTLNSDSFWLPHCCTCQIISNNR